VTPGPVRRDPANGSVGGKTPTSRQIYEVWPVSSHEGKGEWCTR
jgi:hypothetical protein